MAFLAWNEALVIGEPEIDADHARLIAMINAVADTLADQSEAALTRRTLAALRSETACHFHREEELMRRSAYPDLPSHSREHQLMLTQLKVLTNLIGAGTADVGIDILRFLRGWLVDHIRRQDDDLGRHLAAWRQGQARRRAGLG